MPQDNSNGAAPAPANPDDGSAAGPRQVDEAVMDELRRAIGGVEFGSVLVKIHQGEVVGIETSTKVRLKK
jgi:hypothetical protein